MKTVLGLDLGTTSVGWALVKEAEAADREPSSIVKLGVRVNPLTVDEQQNFEKGKSITTTADRTLKRGMRRNLQRYKLRREHLTALMRQRGLIDRQVVLSEEGNFTTFQTYRLRAQAVTEAITLGELARVLLMINKKRGYKSSRKVQASDEGSLIDGMEIARQLYDDDLTPGQLCYRLAGEGKKRMPEFYRSDLQNELDRIWSHQRAFYPEFLTDGLKACIAGKNKSQTARILRETCGVYTSDNKGKEKRMLAYRRRSEGLERQLEVEEVAAAVCDLNGEIGQSSGYLGAIGDRSKELFFNRQTVGQYLMGRLALDPHFSVKKQVFYRADYLNEFEAIWEQQARYHPELTPGLKREVREIVIFYQRPLKSQKGLVAFCEFENRPLEVVIDGRNRVKTIGSKACPKSSPLFQEFKIWQILNDLRFTDRFGKEIRPLEQEEKERLFAELNVKEKLSAREALKLLLENGKGLGLNCKEIEGNRTRAALFAVFRTIIDAGGNDYPDFGRLPAAEIERLVFSAFQASEYRTDILTFDSCAAEKRLHEQPYYRLWHLLYSYEGDNSNTGREKLIDKLSALCGFDREAAALLAGVSFRSEYGRLSSKAMRRVMPFLKAGNDFATACQSAGYRHSKSSLTSDERANRLLKPMLDVLPKNSLRNPVVEKILNQMVHVVNEVIEAYGKPDEIRIELARELKKSAKERKEQTDAIGKSTAEHERIRALLQERGDTAHVSRNDIIRYKLYQELAPRGYKTLYSETYIPEEKIFSDEFNIEHIIPKARLLDDSFSNKTLETQYVNGKKGNDTAVDFVRDVYGAAGLEAYLNRVEELYRSGKIARAKYLKLKMGKNDIPEDFIARELRDSQYIAREAKERLEGLVKVVNTTTGSITGRLRQEWQLVDVMKELNWEKYDRQGMTDVFENRHGKKVYRIREWTKRDDHRHHAMDALTVAFTRPSHVQYLNTLNARSEEESGTNSPERKEIDRQNEQQKLRAPMPLLLLRAEAKRHLEQLLVSFKAKNKVMTRNINTTKKRGGKNRKPQLTPRGQLHNETIYGAQQYYQTKEVKVGAGFTAEQIEQVASKRYREALLTRLRAFDNDPKKAFTGKNSLEKQPLYWDAEQTQPVPPVVKTVSLMSRYTIRKAISPDLKIEKVTDQWVRSILQERLNACGGDPKEAFADLEKYPIWLNEEKQIAIKRVTITGVTNAEPLHWKKDKAGRECIDRHGNRQPVDFVSTSNNHHAAFYCDAQGEMQDRVVSFYEAVSRKSQALPVIDKTFRADEGWSFLFTMKQNEYFVFPNEQTGFDPQEIDLTDPENYARISPNLYRVQKFSNRDYYFRHHLETTVQESKAMKDILYKRLTALSFVKTIVKVRINHIGQIVGVGESPF